jgi:hypothetical protein
MPEPRREEARVVTIWPCDHGGVRVEEGAVPRNYHCYQCGARPTQYLPASLADRYEEALRETARVVVTVANAPRAIAEVQRITDRALGDNHG